MTPASPAACDMLLREVSPLEAALDEALLGPLRTSRPQLVARLFAIYASHAPGLAAAARAGLGRGDLDAVGRAAHSLKSSSANVGASRLSRLCYDLETAGRSQRAAEAACLLSEVERELARVLAAMSAETAA